MELYFLRHAIAAERAEAGVASDAERPLTAEGVQKMKKASQGMKKLGLKIDRVVSSPYIRARHTAEIAAEGIEFKDKLRYSEALTPDASFKDFAKLLKDQDPGAKLLLVGHQPTIGDFVSQLVTGSPSSLSLDFKKGALCFVDIPQPALGFAGQLKWFLTSRTMRELA